MSQLVINHSPDIKELRDNGYEVQVIGLHLVIGGIPYLNSSKELMFGKLITDIVPDRNHKVGRPSTHVIHFEGDYPCNLDGRPIESIRHNSSNRSLGSGLSINHSFSNKPPGGFSDFFDKVVHYINIISAPAMALHTNVTPRTFKAIPNIDVNIPFQYLDTNASRAGIGDLMEGFQNLRIGIIGLGGTGSYILDSVAKTPVKEIHLIDGDVFHQHNAFRAPGAASLDDFDGSPKVEYFKKMYSKIHKGIVAHNCYYNREKLSSIFPLDFVFVSIDNGVEKEKIVEDLENWNTSFIDVGMGVVYNPKGLIATLRTTTRSIGTRNFAKEMKRISFTNEEDDAYSTNIQINDLNAMNAIQAVFKWKKIVGLYLDEEKEHHSVMNINSNILHNDDYET